MFHSSIHISQLQLVKNLDVAHHELFHVQTVLVVVVIVRRQLHLKLQRLAWDRLLLCYRWCQGILLVTHLLLLLLLQI